ncbi:hypothetical protein KEM52_001315, partial [Ascosphaera acerosa]
GPIYVPLSHFNIDLTRASSVALHGFYTHDKLHLARVEIVAQPPASFAVPDKTPTAQVVLRCSRPNAFAFGIDDGEPGLARSVMDILDEEGVKVTFFTVGKGLDDPKEPFGEVYREAVKKGHQVALHSYTHPALEGLPSIEEIDDQLQKNIDALDRVVGTKATYFRPPYGTLGARTLQRLHALVGPKARAIVWSVDIEDWLWAKKKPARQWAAFTRDVDKGGNIVVMHYLHKSTVQYLRDGIRLIKSKGLDIMRVDQCLGDADAPAYVRSWTTGARAAAGETGTASRAGGDAAGGPADESEGAAAAFQITQRAGQDLASAASDAPDSGSGLGAGSGIIPAAALSQAEAAAGAAGGRRHSKKLPPVKVQPVAYSRPGPRLQALSTSPDLDDDERRRTARTDDLWAAYGARNAGPTYQQQQQQQQQQKQDGHVRVVVTSDRPPVLELPGITVSSTAPYGENGRATTASAASAASPTRPAVAVPGVLRAGSPQPQSQQQSRSSSSPLPPLLSPSSELFRLSDQARQQAGATYLSPVERAGSVAPPGLTTPQGSAADKARSASAPGPNDPYDPRSTHPLRSHHLRAGTQAAAYTSGFTTSLDSEGPYFSAAALSAASATHQDAVTSTPAPTRTRTREPTSPASDSNTTSSPTSPSSGAAPSIMSRDIRRYNKISRKPVHPQPLNFRAMGSDGGSARGEDASISSPAAGSARSPRHDGDEASNNPSLPGRLSSSASSSSTTSSSTSSSLPISAPPSPPSQSGSAAGSRDAGTDAAAGAGAGTKASNSETVRLERKMHDLNTQLGDLDRRQKTIDATLRELDAACQQVTCSMDTRKQIRQSMQALEAELAGVRKEQHDLGLKMAKYLKKEEEARTLGDSSGGMWCRRVTG